MAPYRSGSKVTKKQLLEEPNPSWLANEYNDSVRMQNMYMVNIHTNPELVKKYIKEYGAVTASYFHFDIGEHFVGYVDEPDYFSTANSSFCYPRKLNSTNHAVTIV